MNEREIDLSNLEKMIQTFHLCPRCIGRSFGRFKSDLSNITLHQFETLPDLIKRKAVDHSQCSLCYGITEKVLQTVSPMINKLQQIDFQTFLVGTSFKTNQFSKANQIFLDYGFSPLSLKHEINREVGLLISKSIGKSVDFVDPDLHIVIEIRGPEKIKVKIRPKPVYIYGRYKKLIRGIPQTKWPCTFCKGKKCKSCNFTGFQYRTSVEQIISKPLLESFSANTSSFHGAGREDIDALMLGTGRPFIIELKNPKKRQSNLTEIMYQINSSGIVEVTNFRLSNRDEIRKLKKKSEFTRKKYRALIEFEGNMPEEPDLLFPQFPLEIYQRTPKRVSHRRADLIRRKIIYHVDLVPLENNQFEVLIEAQGGAYIKEFISGDDGRTKPSISSILGIKAKCVELDVIAIADEEI